MYDKIFFPTDGSDHAESVLEYALQIATEHEATIHILNVADTGQDSVSVIRGQVIDALEEEGKNIIEKAAGRAREQDISVVADVIQGTPYTTIVNYSDQYGLDCIVIPTHGRSGIQR